MKRFILVLLVLLTASCAVLKQKPVVTQRDTIYISKDNTEKQIDSIYIEKEKIVKEKGDTVYVTEYLYKYKDRWRDKEVHDTTYVDKEVEVIKEVEKKLTKTQNFFLNFGKLITLLLAVLLGYEIYRLIKKFRLI